jgi:diacylglycerol kinase (ATP)
MRNAWLIYNPAAGRFPAGPFLAQAVRVLGNAGWEIELVEGEGSEAVPRLAEEAALAGCHAVFVAGGDGTVGRVASALAGTETALGVLPSGTSNVWAQELGLPRLDWIHLNALELAARRLAMSRVRLVDLGLCNGHAFLLWAGLGLDAHIVNSIEPRERWEKVFSIAHYATLALWNSIGWDGIEIRARSKSQSWSGRYLVAVACNIPAYAGGLFDLAPGAKVDDGLLDFWLIGGQSVRDVVMRVVQIFRGTHVDAPGVVHFRAKEAIFETEASMMMQFDGEPITIESPARFHVERRVLRVLVPADGGPRLFSPYGQKSKFEEETDSSPLKY